MDITDMGWILDPWGISFRNSSFISELKYKHSTDGASLTNKGTILGSLAAVLIWRFSIALQDEINWGITFGFPFSLRTNLRLKSVKNCCLSDDRLAGSVRSDAFASTTTTKSPKSR